MRHLLRNTPSAAWLFVMLVVDILYVLIDPRIRVEGRRA